MGHENGCTGQPGDGGPRPAAEEQLGLQLRAGGQAAGQSGTVGQRQLPLVPGQERGDDPPGLSDRELRAPVAGVASGVRCGMGGRRTAGTGQRTNTAAPAARASLIAQPPARP